MITLYSNRCPMCGLLEAELKKTNIEFVICADIDIMSDKGITKVPMLEVDNKLYDLNEALKWIREEGSKNV